MNWQKWPILWKTNYRECLQWLQHWPQSQNITIILFIFRHKNEFESLTSPLNASVKASGTTSLSHPLYTYGFMLPSETLPHACNWVSVGGPCDKRFSTSEELLAHLRTHTALSGVDGKLLSGYPSSVSSAASCHLHLPPPSSPGALPSSLSLRGSPGLGLARYHPYGKAHLPGAHSLPMHSLPATAPYYSPYALYGQRLGSASALGYQWLKV